MNNWRIQTATTSDTPEIVRMIRDFAEFEKLARFCEVTEEKLGAAMFGAHSCVEGLIAFDDANNAIGYALFCWNFASFRGQRGVYLEDLYVAPEARKSGVGSALLARLAKLAKERGAERINFLVLDWNRAAIRFYEKLGAERDESERHFRFVGASFDLLANVNGRFSD